MPVIGSGLFEPIHEIFGDRISFIFNTRHPKPSLLSFIKVLGAVEPETPEEKVQGGKNFKIVKRSCSLNRYYRVYSCPKNITLLKFSLPTVSSIACA